MPQITVRDPNRPDRPADVLVSGDERVPVDPVVRRRRLRIAGALLLGAAVVASGLEVRDRRAAGAQERRLGAIVELRAEHQGGSSTFDHASSTGRLTIDVQLYNDGPREVSVTAATVAGYELLGQGVRVAAGSSNTMTLHRTVTCDGSTSTPEGDLQLAVRTTTGERSVEIPLPVDTFEADRLCGLRPLETMNIDFGDIARIAPEAYDLGLDLQTQAVEPVQLVGLVAGPGIAVQLRVGGTARTLPIELTPRDGLTRVLSTRIELTVTDCEAGLAPTGPDLPSPVPRSALLVQVRDATGETADFEVSYPAGLLDSLLGESCGSRAS